MTSLKLYGRLIIRGTILSKTGLHIGGSGGNFSIGAVDNAVIKNPRTGEPYIPGSSLRGKMRSLTEKYQGLELFAHAGVNHMHTAEKSTKNGVDANRAKQIYDKSDVAKIYGVPSDDFVTAPTRLIVRDVELTPESRDELRQARTDTPFTEIKTEVSIDRITSQANPRQLERVPAGTRFGDMEMVFSIYSKADVDLFPVLVEGMLLLEDDYLGGSGSRGSGKVVFEGLKLELKTGVNAAYVNQFGDLVFDTAQDLYNELPNGLLSRITATLFGA